MGHFLLLRHAQSTWNAARRWQGQADPPLSNLGEAQTKSGARELASADPAPFDLVITSDLVRAARTAELLMEHLGQDAPIIREPALRELDVGVWSGLTREEIAARWPATLARFDRREPVTPSEGEGRAAFEARVRCASRQVASLATGRSAKRVLVVAHGGVIRALARAVGIGERPIGHLAGYRGRIGVAGLDPCAAVELLADGAGREALACPAPARRA